MTRMAVKDASGIILAYDPAPNAVVAIPRAVIVPLTAQEEAALVLKEQQAVATQQADVVADQTLKQQIVASAQSAVGVLVSDLTAVQRNALIICLLRIVGGIGKDLKIRPLNEWVS